MGVDIKNFYLSTRMKYFHYLQVQHLHIPEEIMLEYDLVVEARG